MLSKVVKVRQQGNKTECKLNCVQGTRSTNRDRQGYSCLGKTEQNKILLCFYYLLDVVGLSLASHVQCTGDVQCQIHP